MNLFHVLGSVPAPDVDKAECVVLWGFNPAASAINRYRRIREAKARGARLIVIDPRTTPLARQADLHLRPLPGSDGALALGMLRIAAEESLIDPDFVKKYTVGFTDLCRLVEQYTPERVAELTWVPEAPLREAARLYASEPSACIFFGQALDQHTNASNSIRAIACLIAVTGHLDVPGGNVVIPPVKLAKNPVELFDELPAKVRRKRLGSQYLLTRFPYTQIAHPPSVFRAILTGDPYPVHAMLVMASNPASVEPHTKQVIEALRRLDFLAVADLFMTDTAKQADLVLPACTFLEDTYYATYEAGSYSKPAVPGLMQLRPKVVEPVGECRPDWRIIFDLAEKLEFGDRFPWADIEQAIDFELEPMGLSVAALKNNPDGIQLPAPPFLFQKLGGKGLPGRLLIGLLTSTVFRGYPEVYRKYKRMGFLTPSGKVELRSSVFEEAGLNPLPVFREPAESFRSAPELASRFPLVLSTGAKTRNFVHSQFHNISRLSRSMPVNLAEIHPETAQRYDVKDGGEIQVETPRGTIRCAANLTPDILPGMVQLFHGFPESNANILTDNHYLDPATGSASMRSELCRVIPG
jgi:anaerobic selenocysteine-containing dehydrogenase